VQGSANKSAQQSNLGASASISLALASSGGSGVMSAGTLLLTAAAKADLYGLMVRTSGPQFRGGGTAALVLLARVPMDTLDDRFDLLLVIDWQNVNCFAEEIPLCASNVMIGDPDEGHPPEAYKAIWCPDCGDYSVLSSITKAPVKETVPPEQVAIVSGIGCSSRIPAYTTCSSPAAMATATPSEAITSCTHAAAMSTSCAS
jgi:Pyruvate/2-oxoacid:ferredoxin oxidoreductase gamma subunit